jgi:succinate dehydrogenase / fumarate reductase membrane anchor subunit
MTMRTPLGRARGLGTGHSGTEHFWRERVTSLAGIPLVVFFIIFIVTMNGADYVSVVQAIRNPFVAIALLLTIVNLVYHMYLGMQIVIEDYVASRPRRTATLLASTFYCTAVCMAAVYAVLKISFGN